MSEGLLKYVQDAATSNAGATVTGVTVAGTGALNVMQLVQTSLGLVASAVGILVALTVLRKVRAEARLTELRIEAALRGEDIVDTTED